MECEQEDAANVCNKNEIRCCFGGRSENYIYQLEVKGLDDWTNSEDVQIRSLVILEEFKSMSSIGINKRSLKSGMVWIGLEDVELPMQIFVGRLCPQKKEGLLEW